MLTNRVLTEQQSIIRHYFIDFFESEKNEGKYQQRIQEMMAMGGVRLLLDMGDLLDFVPSTSSSAEEMLGWNEDGEGGFRFTPVEETLLLLGEHADALSSSSGAVGGGGITNPSMLSLGVRILYCPGKYIPLLELAVHDILLRLQPEYLKVDYRSRVVHVAFDGPIGKLHSPRELYARHLNTMVVIEGIITRQSANRPRVLETVHYCPATNRFSRKEFRDQLTPLMDSSHLPTVNVMLKTDMEGNVLRTELGLSVFRDSQCAILQEAPEKSPTGQLPRQVELRLDDDLVDRVKPGDRVVVVGVYMPYTTSDTKTTVQSILLVNHVVHTAMGVGGSGSGSGRRVRASSSSSETEDAAAAGLRGDPLSSSNKVAGKKNGEEEGGSGTSTLDTSLLRGHGGSVEEGNGSTMPLFLRPVTALEERLAAFARRMTTLGGPSGVLHALSKSIAPTIYGLTTEKSAILLLLVGGVERRAHHSHIRGDINILLVGEPSTAKSQLLRFVFFLSPLALSTTGKGSSGVGLTAAVTVDSYTGERSLSAGAMVLADRGILCVDEFDKMSPQDRVAMHEAMEQQTVTIAKAGIHASLNARCSVLAAANPIYGFYSIQHRLSFNVGLPESLLSRFDLMFIILDQHSSDYNRRIGSYILRNHMTSKPVGLDANLRAVQTVVQREAGEEGVEEGRREEEEEGEVGRRSGGGVSRDSMNASHAARSSSSSFHSPFSSSTGLPDVFSPTTNSNGERIASVEFLQAYIQFAKQGTPRLTEHSQQLVSTYYVQLRAEQQQESSTRDGFFVTARTLEAIIRLATAHAKLRLSLVVEEDDVKVAMQLLRASVYASSSATALRTEDNLHALEPIVPSSASSTTGVSHRQSSPTTRHASSTPIPGDDSSRQNAEWNGVHEHGGKRIRPSTNGTSGASATGEEEMEMGGEGPPRERERRKEEGALPSSDWGSISTPTILTVLRRLQREQRSTVPLIEIHQRLLQTGLFLPQSGETRGEKMKLPTPVGGMTDPSSVFSRIDRARRSVKTDPFLEEGTRRRTGDEEEKKMEEEKSGSHSIQMSSLRRVLKSMQGDAFVFESAEEGGDDVVQFI